VHQPEHLPSAAVSMFDGFDPSHYRAAHPFLGRGMRSH
jgi:hypothetical protein